MQDGEAIDGARLPLKVKRQTHREEATLTIFWHASKKLWRVVAVSGRALSFRFQHEYCASMAMCNLHLALQRLVFRCALCCEPSAPNEA